MHLQTPSVIPLEVLGPLLAMVGFGAYHGLNPGMGWLFALSLGLQQQSERAIWLSLLPIALGHAASLVLVALVVFFAAQFISIATLQIVSALLLIGFGGYKVFNYYRHPRWVGMRVNNRDLVWWSFLMATAHGAGLMIAPVLLGMSGGEHTMHTAAGIGMTGAVAVHTLSMLVVMAVIAWVVYRRFGLMVLRRRWVNFDLIWAGALFIVGGIALATGLGVA